MRTSIQASFVTLFVLCAPVTEAQRASRDASFVKRDAASATAAPVKGPRAQQSASKQFGPSLNFTHQNWGETYWGEGFVYGPTFSPGRVAVADIDSDRDFDFILRPDLDQSVQVIRNLGTSGAFVPGGGRDLDLPDSSENVKNLGVFDFADVTGDGRLDCVALGMNFFTLETFLLYYRNEGTFEEPSFSFVSTLYESEQTTFPDLTPDLVDYDNDGLVDLVFSEGFLTSGGDTRVALARNTGSPTQPNWGSLVEIVELSILLPPPVNAKSIPKANLRDGKADGLK
ncbi:MAG: VCBS repeat-containing protein, partial [Candidatus Hydrogenedentota bacterium]